MTDQQQPGTIDPSAQAIQAAIENLGKALNKVVTGWRAQGALGLAYNGDYQTLAETLQAMPNEQLERTGRAAKILQAACDLERSRPMRK
ncbi:hypothetical protein AB0K18_42900 [Nonomuraea sp. NPDC049421]|uniref:hypothetical protein n=1 Tax=Nonomuraea sp. NPDC049421 TaxID=3155275 RepID=UPI003424465D